MCFKSTYIRYLKCIRISALIFYFNKHFVTNFFSYVVLNFGVISEFFVIMRHAGNTHKEKLGKARLGDCISYIQNIIEWSE